MAKGKGGFLGQDGLNAPDAASGVSATQAGTTSATVSWNAPGTAGSSAVAAYSVSTDNGDGTIVSSNDLNGGSYSGYSLDVSGQESSGSTGVFLKPDGTKIYSIGYGADKVSEYDFATAYDISTATFNQSSSALTSQDNFPRTIAFKPDGTKMYMIGVQNHKVYQYSLSTAWDVSTLSYESKDFYVYNQEPYPECVSFKSDGTKMYVSGSQYGNYIYQYSLSTAWDVSTASYDNVKFYAAYAFELKGHAWSTDGYYLYFISTTGSNEQVRYASLTTAWDFSTATVENQLLNVTPQMSGYTYNLQTGDSGRRLYVVSSGNNAIYQYNTGNAGPYVTSSPATVNGLTSGTSYVFKVLAKNNSGWSAPAESASLSIGGEQILFDWPGTYSWVCPSGVTSVSVVAVGGGASGSSAYGAGGGGGGGLGYKNNYSVTAGSSYTVVVGAGGNGTYGTTTTGFAGGDSYFVSTTVVKGGGGNPGTTSGNTGTGGTGGTYYGDGGGDGGPGGGYSGNGHGGGGGAGGYSGAGGRGGSQNGFSPFPSAGSGGAGGGGGASGGGGGGVGLLGEGTSGSAGGTNGSSANTGGSGGDDGTNSSGNKGQPGGKFGGGAGAGYAGNFAYQGAIGGVRIIYMRSGGVSRTFPSTNTGDL